MKYWSNNQLKIPKLGFGTYLLKGRELVSSVQYALKMGLRHIDTAQIYGNEADVGLAIKESPVPREEIFLTTKIWRDSLDSSSIRKTFKESLNKLQTDYVDLLLIHWPCPEVPLRESLEAFKELKSEKKIRYIGVSNFTCNLLEEAKKICPELISNQVEYHPLLSQRKLLKLIDQQNVFLTAYSPLARGKIFKIQQIINISKKYGKSPSQIVLKWLIDQENVVAIFKSGNKKHIQENCNIFDFEINPKDRLQLFNLNRNTQRIIDPPFAPEWDE